MPSIEANTPLRSTPPRSAPRPLRVAAKPLAIPADTLDLGSWKHSVAGSMSVDPQQLGTLWTRVKAGFTRFWQQASDKIGVAGKWLYRAVSGTSTDPFKSRTVSKDPSSVNDLLESDVAAAKKALAANRAKETSALAALKPAERTQYAALRAQVAEKPFNERALQRMLLSGRLADQDLSRGATALDQLSALAKQPLAAGIDRQTLLAEVIAEADEPTRIAQHSKGTCGATTAQILLAREHPSEYLRLVSGLAGPSGTAITRSGDTIRRASDWQAEDGGRTTSSRLIQPAFMDLAQLPFTHYDNTSDHATIGPIKLWTGLAGFQEASLLNKVMDRPWGDHLFFRWNRDASWERTKQALDHGVGPLPVAMGWEGGGHFVQIDRIEGGQVFFTNPWGERDQMDEGEFKDHVSSVQWPDGVAEADWRSFFHLKKSTEVPADDTLPAGD